MTLFDVIWTFLAGVMLGWFIHSLFVHAAYRLGIIEYHGLKDRK